MDKPTLPIKTKIAAWWMFIVGISSLAAFILEIVIGVSAFVNPPSGDEALGIVFLIIFLSFLAIISLLIGISLLVPSIYLLKGKRRAHKFAIVILPIEIVIPIILYLSFEKTLENFSFYIIILTIILAVVLGIPFIFLILDRRNFLRIAS